VRPEQTPIGLQLTQTARAVARAFDEALGQAGGSLPVWLVLLNLKVQSGANQRQLADGVGITGATLTHHLNAMERDGLLARRRDPENRRNHVVELTPVGEAAFTRLAGAARAFDERLRGDLEAAELEALRSLLDRLRRHAGAEPAGPAPS
jgi:MarR family transcriptional regulator for hemolysin